MTCVLPVMKGLLRFIVISLGGALALGAAEQAADKNFRKHCVSCHGNDGKGKTAIGENLYPRAPDMTLPDTQELSDGELFAVIENGIRLTGMPGWGSGTAESGYGSWGLVHFIRHLPAEMEALNPKTPEEREQMQTEEATPTPAQVVDPVCGMKIDPRTAAGSSAHAGKTYWFCSKGEKAKFDKNPGAYLKKG